MKITMIMMSILFLFMKHPLSMGLILLIQTFLLSMYSGSLMLNYWYSYILTLIMIGGMLILFIYMTSIASNEKFKFNFKLLNLMLIIMLIMFILMFFYDKFINLYSYSATDIMLMNKFNYYNIQMSKFYNYPYNMIMLMIIVYLLISMIAVVKISMNNQGPLRQMF